MAPKRKADAADGGIPKIRKSITMEVTVDIVRPAQTADALDVPGKSDVYEDEDSDAVLVKKDLPAKSYLFEDIDLDNDAVKKELPTSSDAHDDVNSGHAAVKKELPTKSYLHHDDSETAAIAHIPHTKLEKPDSSENPTDEEEMSAGKAKIGKPAPDFTAKAVMPDGQFKDLTLSDYRGKYVVFFFYPLDFTFVCPTEIIAFSDAVAQFKKINCEVIGASVDSHFCHLAWINTPKKQGGLGHMNIPLVADSTRSISQDYGVLKEDEGISYRGLFIIDDKGTLRQITINDLPVGRSVEETLRLVQAFQFTDKHGEVCPADWKPGEDTIKPDVQKSKEFFSKQK